MRTSLFAAVFVCVASSVGAQCLPIPAGNTQALVWSVFDGKPFTQQTLEDAMPFLNRYGIALTPPNAGGEKTKVGDPLSLHWTRVGFGEGTPVWIQQGDAYAFNPAICGTTVPVPIPVPVPTPVPPTTSLIDYALIQRIVSADGDVTRLQLKAHDDRPPGILEKVLTNKELWTGVATAITTYLVTK